MSTTLAATAAPIAQSERIDSLDVLRGFALLGILLMNIQMFAMPYSAYLHPTLYGDFTGANHLVWFLCRIFADQKFMTIFSMLFGAGVIVFTTRVQERGGSPARLHYFRSFWLLAIGLMHAYLLWPGDILVSYAVCAMLVYPFRKLSPTPFLVIGLRVVSVGSVLTLMDTLALTMLPPGEIVELRVGSAGAGRNRKGARGISWRLGGAAALPSRGLEGDASIRSLVVGAVARGRTHASRNGAL
jgi:uncharacterized protein